VRRVTQDNRGKKTAGIDGVKALSPKARLHLANNLSLSQTASPVRRVWIPKPGKTEKRPLGIPTMRDRAEQALAKLALDPEWEARFEPNSYGFRPGRCTHDAIEAIFKVISPKPKYVLDTDIAACFDRISHPKLLDKLDTFPTMRRAIRAWLKAGVMEGPKLFPTKAGSPQGGVVSPLLANIALHGLETAVAAAHPQAKVIRYADDLVVLHPELSVIEEARETVAEWLQGVGLELKPSKTRITHTLHEHDGNVGFDFLGFHVRQYKVGKHRSGKSGGRRPKLLGYKTIIKPNKEAIRRHYLKIKRIINKNRMAPQHRLIQKLNPVIRGWCKYYSTVTTKDTFPKLSRLTFIKLRRWARRRHPRKSWKWLARQYWQADEKRRWNFKSPEGLTLHLHTFTRVKRHVKVRGTKSPYDGDWAYWATRRAQYPSLSMRKAKLLKRQEGRCTYCWLYFTLQDRPEVDHVIPREVGGEDKYGNWQLLHRHCHHQKTARDRVFWRTEAPMTEAN
jgi:RNA-directed DNA polymerase